jgi:protein ImuB
MFACLYLPPLANASTMVAQRFSAVIQLGRDFSPRVETHGDRAVTLDISGLGSLIGAPRAIGEELRRTAADAGLPVHIAIAATSTAALLLAHARAGLTVVPQGEEAKAVAPLPLDLLDRLASASAFAPTSRIASTFAPTSHIATADKSGDKPVAPELKRWGLKTLGDVASLPVGELSARLGQHGLRWQKWARGEEMRPLVPAGVTEQFEQSLDLEWPIEGLEPLSFVLARLLDPLCDRLERRDRGAVVLRITLKLVTRELHERVVELPAPMRDARVLRTLALLDLESNPPSDAIDRVTVGVDVTEGRILQFGLFARALPSDKLATLMARLGALMGTDRVGSPALVDTYRPGAFAMAKFDPPRTFTHHQSPGPARPHHQWVSAPQSVLRRFRSPIPARVEMEQGRPVRVTTDRRGFSGGCVERSDGPWRSSGDWWCSSSIVDRPSSIVDRRSSIVGQRSAIVTDDGRWTMDDGRRRPWNCDEWDVALRDGTTYRISHAHDSDAWFVDGTVD